jgi:hypothetical protein
MCKKILFVLALLAMVSPAMAIIRGHYIDSDVYPDGHPGDNIILKVDIDANGYTGAGHTQDGWTGWEAENYWGAWGPFTRDFGYGTGLPYVQIDGIQDGTGGNIGGSRNRTTPAAVPGSSINDNDFALVYKDLIYVATSGNMGEDFLKIDMLFGDDYANLDLQVTLFCWDPAFKGSGIPGFGGAGEPPDSKYVAWSQTNPDDWLAANGYPDGYGFSSTPGESNMPSGLADLVCCTVLQHGTATWLTEYDDAYGMLYSCTCEVTTDEYGQLTLYGWSEMLSSAGSAHVSLNGFIISLPEPATIALLGLGGLALIRRKR